MYKPTHVKNALSAIEKSNQINLIVSNYCRVFSDTNDKSIRTEHIAKTLSLLNISPYIIVVAFQRLSMTQNEMPTLNQVLNVIRSVEKTAGVIANNAPKPINAWHEVIRHLSAITPPAWSHPFIEEAVYSIGKRYIMKNEWEARDLFINVYKELCEDELNRTLICFME